LSMSGRDFAKWVEFSRLKLFLTGIKRINCTYLIIVIIYYK